MIPVGSTLHSLSVIVLLTAVVGNAFGQEDAKQDKWNAFAPLPAEVAPPDVDGAAWSENAMDRFVFAALREKGLSPAAEIDRRTWLRRVTYDLIGLPPTPDEVADFVEDSREDRVAYGAVVDRLLRSPHYGEHWGRHWLDVVRYADTDGFAIDGERPLLWRYRDYIIRAINEDRPFDQLIREQVAGDEFDYGVEGLIASSFYRLGPYELDNMTPENRRQDFLNEMTSAISGAFLGLTVGCARCHDHKYDPIPQADFYRLQAFLQPYDRKAKSAEFLDVEMTPVVKQLREWSAQEATKLKKAEDEHRAALRSEVAVALGVEAIDDKLFEKALKGERVSLEPPKPEPGKDAKPGEETDAEADAEKEEGESSEEKDAEQQDEKPPSEAEEAKPKKPKTYKLPKERRDKLEQLKTAVTDHKWTKRFDSLADTIIATEKVEDVAKTHVLANGDPFAKEEAVEPGCLTSVPAWSSELEERIKGAAKLSAGRRKVLADWLADPQNPLTPRVYVNRVWQHHFDVGIVATSNDFGLNGSGPSHPKLLDYLTRMFIDGGWRTKPLHRMIVLSRTYRSSTQHAHWDDSAKVDPDNRLLWRAPLRRLQAESIRDALLSVSGQLNPAAGGPGFFDVLPDGMRAKWAFFSWTPSPDEQRRRRSIYMFQRRNLVHPVMEAFDVADQSQPCERRGSAVTAAQSLALLNGKFAKRASVALAEQLRDGQATDEARVNRLFLLAYARDASAAEVADCRAFLDEKRAHYKENADSLALRDLCMVVLSSNEFLYVE